MRSPTVLVAIALGLLPAAARAQQDTLTLKPVVVTATRVTVPADVVASAVTVIRGDRLRADGIRTVAAALWSVPGAGVVETGSFGGTTSLFLRGGESDYVKVLIDGIPLNQAGGGLNLANLTTDNVDRIEVVHGPASVLYGSDAMTGVIQIFTRTSGAHPAPRVSGNMRAGTYGTTDGGAALTGGGARLSYALEASRFGSNGIYAYNNEYRNSVASAHVRVAPGARTEANLSYRYGDGTYHTPTNGAGEPADSNAFSVERGPAASLALHHRFGTSLEASLLTTLREAKQLFRDSADSPGEDGSFWSRDYVRRATVGGMITWHASPGTILTAGVDYEDERQRGRSEFSASFGTFPDSVAVQRWTTGYYGQAILGAQRPVVLTLGVRADDNSAFGTHATFRAGATWRLDERTRLRAAVGTGFKEPTFFENFARGFVQGNPTLDPERSGSWEAGLEHTVPGDRVSFAVTYFDQRFRDLIEFTLTPPPGAPNYFNVAGATADGVEAEVNATLQPGVAIGVTYTYLDTRVQEAGLDGGADGLFVAGQRLLRRPSHALSPRFDVTLGDRTYVTVTARWVGARDDLDFSRPAGDRRVTLRPYTRVGVSAQYDVRRGGGARGPGLVLTAEVQNAFNDQSSEIAGFKPRGRTLLFGGSVSVGR